MSKSVVVIGGGVGGLSAAVRLAALGHRVTLVEKNAQVGGKLNRWITHPPSSHPSPHPHRPTDSPFYFDTGPSLITLPQVFHETFHAAGTTLEAHLTLKRLDPIQKYIWADGTHLSGRANPADMLTELERFAPGSSAQWQAVMAVSKIIWDLSGDLFLRNAPEQVLKGDGKGFDPKRALSMLTVPFRIGMFARYCNWVNRHVSHPRLREVLYQYATYSGASPFRAPATLLVIPHAEYHFGGWYIQGGLYKLAEALVSVGKGLGVTYLLNTAATEVLIDPLSASPSNPRKNIGIVRGVKLASGQDLPADIVIMNADVPYAYQNLIPARFRKTYPDTKLSKMEPGGSGMILLLGVQGTYPQLAHHTKFMPNDYASDLRAMFETKTIPDDPCIYVCASTRSDPTQAPEGCENLFVLASAPALQSLHAAAASSSASSSAPPLTPPLDWSTASQTYRDKLIHLLETRYGLTDLSRRIVVEKRYTPVTLKTDYNANAGSIYGLGSNSRRAAFLRPPNRDRDVSGLFFAGGATHPGGGLPLVTLSGKIASELAVID